MIFWFSSITDLKHCDKIKYLGYLISCKTKYKKKTLDDDPEIKKRICDIYMRAYMIRSYFSKCSPEVKCKLYKSYLSSIYCCSTWNININKEHPIRIAHNNSLRIVFDLLKRCSISEAFVQRRIGNISYILRISCNSLQQRLASSTVIKYLQYFTLNFFI